MLAAGCGGAGERQEQKPKAPAAVASCIKGKGLGSAPQGKVISNVKGYRDSIVVAPTQDNLFHDIEQIYVFGTPAAAKAQVKAAEQGWFNTGAPEHTKVVGPYLLVWEKTPAKGIASKVETCLAE